MATTHLDENVPVAIVIKEICVGDFELGHISTPHLRFTHELIVRISLLRVLVEHLHVAVSGCIVEIVVQLLDIFSMVA